MVCHSLAVCVDSLFPRLAVETSLCLALSLLALLEQGRVRCQTAKDLGPDKPTHGASSIQNTASLYLHIHVLSHENLFIYSAQNETKRNEMKLNETKRNETECLKTERNATAQLSKTANKVNVNYRFTERNGTILETFF